jgi:hypothetical protein
MKVLHTFSGTVGEAVNLVSVAYYLVNLLTWPCQIPFSPAMAMFIGIDILLAAPSLNTLFTRSHVM